ncbi:hypothetical protein Hypma_015770 [Hypsizygus marmoreus]|uniref:Uncharacterized protein n=1 Tax=Hypsizygus marmoreus TaxID=39966 RepID=A0A369K6U5_HYPMA|nr:hypothetical protein Hypma_015770 [Hypsizygus marmoreus]
MASAFPSDSPSLRTWWSLAPKHPHISTQDLRRPYSEKASRSSKPSGLKSIASAMGFKSKKHPTLAIQDPVFPPSRPAHPTLDTNFVTRPPSKSVSSTRSRVDSLEPRTPLDDQRVGRHSLLTLSDIDPFAVRGVVSAPHTPSDLNRLSAHSNSSIPDFFSKNPDSHKYNRISYASSSSNSNPHGPEPSPLSQSTHFPVDSGPTKKLKPKRSVGSLIQKQSSPIYPDESLGLAWESLAHTHANRNLMSKSGSSTTLTDKNRLSQPEPTPVARPQMRARGMTDSGAIARPGFLPPNDTAPPKAAPQPQPPTPSRSPSTSSPRVIIRQPSVSRIGLPPSSPPRHELPPPPPMSKGTKADSEAVVSPSNGSASSSSLSFASSVSSHKDVMYNQSYSPRQKEKKPLDRSSSSKAELDESRNTFPRTQYPPSTAPRTLKKALSHQSLSKRGYPSSSPAAPATPPEVLERPMRKQRSFHQPKLPVPSVPIPLRNSNSVGSQLCAPSSTDNLPVSEQKRGSAGGISIPTRKRLFSGSRRPSTSQSIPPDDDNRSMFSVRSDSDQQAGSSFFKSLAPPLSPAATSSFWEPAPETMPSSPAHEYMPQQIMSPAEMARVEASVEESSIYLRKRGFSILSSSTMLTSDGEDESPSSTLSPLEPIPRKNGSSTGSLPSRSNSLLTKGLTVPPRLSVRPSTSQANITVPSPTETSSPKASTSSSQPMMSLPPPPRRPRPRPAVVPVPILSPTPPPIPAPILAPPLQAPLPDESFGIATPLPPPPVRKSIRAKVSVEKALHRRSIMRKPSFLEIDDDTDDRDTDVESIGEPLGGSFLDLARESFDTVRSISE